MGLYIDSADGMMFGALEKCPHCEGHMEYQGGSYRCRGFLSAWSKCTFTTQTPKRVSSKWETPEDTDNEYLLQVFCQFPLGRLSQLVEVVL